MRQRYRNIRESNEEVPFAAPAGLGRLLRRLLICSMTGVVNEQIAREPPRLEDGLRVRVVDGEPVDDLSATSPGWCM
jgi:hypothetical protein